MKELLWVDFGIWRCEGLRVVSTLGQLHGNQDHSFLQLLFLSVHCGQAGWRVWKQDARSCLLKAYPCEWVLVSAGPWGSAEPRQCPGQLSRGLFLSLSRLKKGAKRIWWAPNCGPGTRWCTSMRSCWAAPGGRPFPWWKDPTRPSGWWSAGRWAGAHCASYTAPGLPRGWQLAP